MTGLDERRELVAQGCRVAAARGLVDGILGHLSLRVDDERLLVRCRSDTDAGVAFTRPSDIRLVTFDGSPGAAGELDGYRVPNELPIHVETMLANPEHGAVAHLHPPDVVAADLAGIQIRPIYGAFDIPGAWLARGGVPVYERAVLIRNSALGKEMVAAMGGASVRFSRRCCRRSAWTRWRGCRCGCARRAAHCATSTSAIGTTCRTWGLGSTPTRPGGTKSRGWANVTGSYRARALPGSPWQRP
jgi:ribulose-5-phosphate 4-epimerase/fuculose-1-phosphate aldolase